MSGGMKEDAEIPGELHTLPLEQQMWDTHTQTAQHTRATHKHRCTQQNSLKDRHTLKAYTFRETCESERCSDKGGDFCEHTFMRTNIHIQI